jgi:hypothetical protein
MARCRAFLGKRKYDNGEEEWKEFMYHDNYEISNMGNMRRKNPPFIIKPFFRNNEAATVNICNVWYRLGRMVAMHFIPNPENHPCAFFLNGDNMDCRASNLIWSKKGLRINTQKPTQGRVVLKRNATTKEIVQTYISKADAAQDNCIYPNAIEERIRRGNIHDGHTFEYKEIGIIGEEWIKCLEPGLEEYECSTMDRIRGKSKKPRYFQDSNDGYLALKINGKGYRVHRLIAISFHNDSYKEGLVVNHIDSNRKNNCPENLEWVTQRENVIKSQK